MAREWEAGDVAVATINLWTGRLIRGKHSWTDQDGEHWEDRESPMLDSTVRPLVVIDPEDADQIRALTVAFCAMEDSGPLPDVPMSSPQLRMRAALRSLLEPPRPDEPTGLGAVVVDGEGRRYIRTADQDCTKPWSYANNYSDHDWADVAAVRVLSEGVPS